MSTDFTAARASRDIARNAIIHDELDRRYDAIHGEIFNQVEQARLAALLARAKAKVRGSRSPRSTSAVAPAILPGTSSRWAW